MKILVVSSMFPSYPQDKNYKFIYDSIRALIALGHEVKVIIPQAWQPKWTSFKTSTRAIQFETFPDDMEIIVGRFLSIPRFYCYSFSQWSYEKLILPVVKKIAKQWQCDVIHVHSEAQTPAISRIGKALDIPVVTTMHGIETHPRFWRYAKNKMSDGLKQASRVVLVGDAIRPFYETLAQQNHHFRVVQNGFDAPQTIYMHEKQSWDAKLKIISVGSLADEGKGIDINLQALAGLLKIGFSNWEYTVIGEGCLRPSLEALARRLGLEKQVKFLGAFEHAKIYDYLLNADIFCLPSHKEAFGIAHLEAMACGLLTIAVKGQGPEMFITHNETGLLVEPNNVESLTDRLKIIFSNQHDMQLIAKKGKQHVWENYTWLQHAKKLEQVYQEL